MKQVMMVLLAVLLSLTGYAHDEKAQLQLEVQYTRLQKQVDSWDKGSKEKNLKEIVKLAVEIAKQDPSHYVGEILLPLHEKKNSGLMPAVRKLNKKDRELLQQKIRAAEKEAFSGNG